jgi:hypothetical protein
MFKKYRPAALGNGNGAADVAEPIVAQNATKAPPIERKPGQENSSTFWNMFASGDRDRLAERETAIYVVRTIVGEVLGAHRVGQVNFEDGDITVDDVQNAIDRKVGVGNAAGWQRLQTRAGIKPGPGAWWHRHVEQEMSKKKEKNRHVAASFDSGKFEAFSSGSWQALSGTELHRARDCTDSLGLFADIAPSVMGWSLWTALTVIEFRTPRRSEATTLWRCVARERSDGENNAAFVGVRQQRDN